MHILNPGFREALSSQRVLRGIFNSLPCPSVVEICAQVGFDFIVQDNEHGSANLETTEHMLRASSAYGTPTVVRCFEQDVPRVLDCGAIGIQVPMVQTAEMADRIARAARYPVPGDLSGTRGCAFSGRAAGFGLSGGPQHVERSNASVVFIAMLESPEAISRASEIASVEGVHAVFIGPNDLAHSMGYLNNWLHPDVQHQIELGLRAIALAGKCPGILSVTAEEDDRYQSWGARYLACTTTGLITQAFHQARQGPNKQGQY
jgi:4-hydroxy-2-oxoheptanedioate aldolase